MEKKITLKDLLAYWEGASRVHKVFTMSHVNRLNLRSVCMMYPRHGDGIIQNCGIEGDLLGCLPYLSPSFTFNADGNLVYNGEVIQVLSGWLMSYFGIEREAAYHLFFPNEQNTAKYGGVDRPDTEYKAVSNLREFIKRFYVEEPQKPPVKYRKEILWLIKELQKIPLESIDQHLADIPAREQLFRSTFKFARDMEVRGKTVKFIDPAYPYFGHTFKVNGIHSRSEGMADYNVSLKGTAFADEWDHTVFSDYQLEFID